MDNGKKLELLIVAQLKVCLISNIIINHLYQIITQKEKKMIHLTNIIYIMKDITEEWIAGFLETKFTWQEIYLNNYLYIYIYIIVG